MDLLEYVNINMTFENNERSWLDTKELFYCNVIINNCDYLSNHLIVLWVRILVEQSFCKQQIIITSLNANNTRCTIELIYLFLCNYILD